jgi:hypothetical protein
VTVAAGREQDTLRDLAVMTCPAKQSARAAAELAITLGRAAGRTGPAVFVFPSTSETPGLWDISDEPPPE